MESTRDTRTDRATFRPRRSIPAPLRGTDSGSFAEYTVVRRLPDIARRVLEENTLDAEASRSVQSLIGELPAEHVRPLRDPEAPDEAAWNEVVAREAGNNWLEVPWFFAETYFYRRVVEAVGYFGANGRGSTDPFEYQKRRGLELSARLIDADYRALSEMLGKGWHPEHVVRLLKADLWGNQADLSLWPADDQNHPSHTAEDADAHLLVDHARQVARYLDEKLPAGRVDVILDNAGFELIGDLALVDYLLTTDAASRAVLHVKLHPTFVSDATDVDLQYTVKTLLKSDSLPTRESGQRLAQFLETGRLEMKTNAYWTSALDGWEMPEDVRADLGQADLVVAKGDANYRRLLGDRHWPLDTPFEDVVSYFPAPLVALRTYKSEVGCGLSPERVAALDAEDPSWRTNGRWGIIQSALSAERDTGTAR